MKPKVSITMSVLNGARYIDEALASILAQTFHDFELIVVDDGSTDQTCEHVQRFIPRLDLKYIRHTQTQGIVHSLNDGIRHSSGEFIAFLDHDDAWLPDFLETQVTYLDQHADVAMVHSDFQTIDSEGNVLEHSVAASRGRMRPSGNVFAQLFMDSFIVGNSVLIRRECLEQLGSGFEESLRFGDYHLWLRMARHFKIDYVDKVLTQYRQHANQSTNTVPLTTPDQESVAVQSIQKILDLYPAAREELGERAIRQRLASLYFDLAYFCFSKGRTRYARTYLAKSIGFWPTNSTYYVMYAATLLPLSIVAVIRTAWHLMRNLQCRAQRCTEPSG
jgi:glycosyltransferase involved in cell wall biosynthesis